MNYLVLVVFLFSLKIQNYILKLDVRILLDSAYIAIKIKACKLKPKHYKGKTSYLILFT